MSSHIRHRILPRIIGAYAIRQETNNSQQNNSSNLFSCWDPGISAYPARSDTAVCSAQSRSTASARKTTILKKKVIA